MFYFSSISSELYYYEKSIYLPYFDYDSLHFHLRFNVDCIHLKFVSTYNAYISLVILYGLHLSVPGLILLSY